MSEYLPPVELLPADERDDLVSVVSGTDPDRLHTWLRTVSVIVGALSLLWVGFSAAGVRAADERQVCFLEIQNSMWTMNGPQTDDDVGAELADKADDCGLPLFADVLRDEFGLD